jgi:hypothetical protein
MDREIASPIESLKNVGQFRRFDVLTVIFHDDHASCDDKLGAILE